MGAVPVNLRNNRISRHAEAGLSPLPLRTQLEQLLAVFRQRAKVIRREKPWVRTRIKVPRPGGPGRRLYKPKLPRAGDPRRGHCGPKFPTRLPTGWHHRFLTLLMDTPQTKWCCSGSPRPIFRSGRLRRLSSTACHILAQSSCDGRKSQAFQRPSHS